jgi:hypothetical protein
VRAGRLSIGRGGALALAALLVGCGLLMPTPARNRPPLPEAEPMPNLAVQEVVAQLEVLGFECWYDSGGDIPSSWNCSAENREAADALNVGLASGETGPITNVSAYRHREAEAGEAMDPAALDRLAASEFDDIVALIVPEAHRPTFDGLARGVASNYPMELGGGWYLGFDRSSTSRSLNMVYSEQGGIGE